MSGKINGGNSIRTPYFFQPHSLCLNGNVIVHEANVQWFDEKVPKNKKTVIKRGN